MPRSSPSRVDRSTWPLRFISVVLLRNERIDRAFSVIRGQAKLLILGLLRQGRSTLPTVSAGPGVIVCLVHHYAQDVGSHALQPFTCLLSIGPTVLVDAQSEEHSVRLGRHYTGIDHPQKIRCIDHHEIKLIADIVEDSLETRGSEQLSRIGVNRT